MLYRPRSEPLQPAVRIPCPQRGMAHARPVFAERFAIGAASQLSAQLQQMNRSQQPSKFLRAVPQSASTTSAYRTQIDPENWASLRTYATAWKHPRTNVRTCERREKRTLCTTPDVQPRSTRHNTNPAAAGNASENSYLVAER